MPDCAVDKGVCLLSPLVIFKILIIAHHQVIGEHVVEALNLVVLILGALVIIIDDKLICFVDFIIWACVSLIKCAVEVMTLNWLRS